MDILNYMKPLSKQQINKIRERRVNKKENALCLLARSIGENLYNAKTKTFDIRRLHESHINIIQSLYNK